MDRGHLEALTRLAACQHNLLTVAQAAERGISVETLARGVTRGWVRHVRRGVYAFAGPPPSRWEPIVAAALVAGATVSPDDRSGACVRAAVSHRSAAAIHRLPGVLMDIPELTVGRRHRSRMSGVRVYRRDDLVASDIHVRNQVWVTRPARTICDLAAVLDPDLLATVLDEGAIARRWTYGEVAATFARTGGAGIAGSTALRRLLRHRVGEPTPDSHLEQRMIRALSPLRPFEVHHQVVVDGQVLVVDVAWPWAMVAAEVDGRHHRVLSRGAFDRERQRMNLLAAAGWKIAHLTSTMADAVAVSAVRRLLPLSFGHKLTDGR